MRGWRILAIPIVAAGLWRTGYADTVEFTPFYGYMFSGGLKDADTGEKFEIEDSDSHGGMLDFRLSDMTQLEFFFSRQKTELESDEGLFAGHTLFDLDVDYYHVGGTYLMLDGPWQPFVVGTIGVTHLNPDASDADSLTRFSIGLGGGVRYVPTRHLGLYLAGRGFLTFIDSEVLWRSEPEGTTIMIDANGLWQFQLQAGLIFAF